LRLNDVDWNFDNPFSNPLSQRKPIEACGTMLRATHVAL
jgi:hypothetical protein